MTPAAAQQFLKDTNSGDKNELLFTKFGINYNNIDPLYRKGSVLYRGPKKKIQITHEDLISVEFWKEKNILE